MHILACTLMDTCTCMSPHCLNALFLIIGDCIFQDNLTGMCAVTHLPTVTLTPSHWGVYVLSPNLRSMLTLQERLGPAQVTSGSARGTPLSVAQTPTAL